MIEVEITKEMLEKATERANSYKNNLNNSILKGEGTIVGCLGEELFQYYLPEAKYVGSYNFDFEYKEKRFDIKTKQRSVKPKDHYDCSVNIETYNQDTDYYVFVSVMNDFSKGWLLGYTNKNYFLQNSIIIKKGERDPSNDFYAHATMRNIKINQLAGIEHLK